MRTTWKFPLAVRDGVQCVHIPESATLLHVGSQFEAPALWYSVDPESPLRVHRFSVHGTGHPLPEGGTYLGTAVGSRCVWHVYEVAA